MGLSRLRERRKLGQRDFCVRDFPPLEIGERKGEEGCLLFSADVENEARFCLGDLNAIIAGRQAGGSGIEEGG